jgi:hypothetical protein
MTTIASMSLAIVSQLLDVRLVFFPTEISGMGIPKKKGPLSLRKCLDMQ